jgi:ribonuclease HI
VIHVDGSSTKKNGSAGVVLKTLGGKQLCNSLRLEFRITNNKAEYEAVLAGLKLAQEMGTECLEVRSDSQVIVGYIKGEFEFKGEKMKLYLS